MRGKRRAPRPGIAWRSPWTPVAGVAAALVVAGLVTVSHLAKDVRIVVDGRVVALRSFAGSVRELLDEAGVDVSSGDYLFPGGQEDLADGEQIVVRHARPITLTVDGHTTRHLVTAGNVGDALAELHITQAGGRISAPPSGAVPLQGMALTMFTRRRVYVQAGGAGTWARTTGASVREVLRQRRIRLQAGDRVDPPLDSFPREGTVIRVVPAGSVLPPHTMPVLASVARLNWAALAACESRGSDTGHYGMYRLSLPMWRAVGGQGTPGQWPAEEQTYRAQLLYQRAGGRWQAQWPDCGADLFG